MNTKKGILYLAVGAALLGAGVFAANKLGYVASTLENLKVAYIGEVNTKARYEAFAVRSDEEGYLGVSSLFRAVAESEGIHAANHEKAVKALGAAVVADVERPKVRSTKENLEWVIAAENREYHSLYPEFVKKAAEEDNTQAVMSFRGAMASEGGHLRLFSEAASNLEQWKEKRSFTVCRSCGYTSADFDLKICPFCTQPRSQFMELK